MPFPTLVIKYRWWVVAGWLLLASVVVPAASRVEKRLDVTASVPGSESARVQAIINSRFPGAFPSYAVLVVTGGAAPATSEGRDLLLALRENISPLHSVSKTLSYLDAPDSAFIGPAGETYMLVGMQTRGPRAEELVPQLRAITTRLESGLHQRFPNLRLRWTGEMALNYDLRIASASDARGAERRVLPLTAILLVIAFGGLAAAVLPVLAGAVSISLALGAAVLLTNFWPLSLLLQNVVAMLGLGLGIDYALLVVGRFREALAEGKGSRDAAIETIEKAGHTVALSGASVAIAFASLLMVPVNEIRSIAVGGLLVIVIAVLLATSLLPALLSLIGSRINAGTIRRKPFGIASTQWRRWGRFVCAHPLAVLIVASAPLGAVAWQARRLTTDLPRGDWLPRDLESSRALRTLTAMHTSGVVNAIRIVVELPDGVTWDSPAGWSALRHLSTTVQRDKRVARVRSITTVTGLVSPNLEVLARIPTDVRESMVTSDGHLALVEVLPSEGDGVAGAGDLVRSLRGIPAETSLGISGGGVLVGGLPALNVDYEQSTMGHFPPIVIAVVGVTLISLLVGFKSALIAVKAAILNLFSVAVAFGAVVLVFQDGHGIGVVGLDAALGGTFPAIPLLVFCVVFGLSMDYEVFLVSRITEAKSGGMSDDEAIAEGLARTGGLISSAAAIMIAVFGAFMLGDFVLIKILGFALAVAVLVDATVVRIAIGPALIKLGGKWNWWPGKTYPMVRTVPSIQLESTDGRLDAPSQSVS